MECCWRLSIRRNFLELLALVIINLLFAVVLYYAVSIKVTNSVKEYQSKKFKTEMNKDILSFYKESESYLAQMDSRIIILKNLIRKAESLNLDKQSTMAFEDNQLFLSRVHSDKATNITVQNKTGEKDKLFSEEIPAVGVKQEYLKNEFILRDEVKKEMIQ